MNLRELINKPAEGVMGRQVYGFNRGRSLKRGVVVRNRPYSGVVVYVSFKVLLIQYIKDGIPLTTEDSWLWKNCSHVST